MEELNKKITKKRNLTPIIVIGGVFVFLFLFLPAGAAQAATNIYYSVGQNTSDHKTGTPTITISDGVATFSEAQTALNMGVGDKISFGDANATTTVYISAKQSTTVWNIVTAKGLQPIATTTAAVLKISHAFSSLENAVTSASGADYLNTIDLVGGDYVLNIPCYFDSGPDQTAVTISGWTTGSGNYIKIYTPVSTSTETNSSQRHRGKWDDSKYSLVMPITETSENTILVADSYTRIEGLQLKTPIYLSTYNRGIYVYNSEQPVVDVRISGNLITEGSGNIDGGRGILFSSTGSQHGYIYNNIIYGFNGSGDTYAVYLNSQSGENSLVYNNTVTNSTVGIYIANSINLLKNNLCFDNGADYSGTADPSSTNNAYSNGADPGANGLDISSYAPTAIFAAPGDNDFLLTKNSPAIDQGADLSADPNLSFSLDVKNQTRLGAWDIGADEFSSSSVIVSPTKISLVASTVAGGEPGDGVTTAPINTVGATLLVVGLHVLETTSTLSITDNMNNNWHHLKAYGIAGASGFAQIWYAYDATTSAAQTFSVNGASNNWPTLTVSAWSGTATTSDVFDVENGNATTTSNTINSGSVKPAVNGELLISLLSNPYDDDANPQISDGFQIIKKLNNGDSMVGVMTSLVASSTDSINPNWTVAGSMVQNSVAIAAFKPATTEGAAPATTTPEQIYRSVGPGDTRALASSTQSAVNLLSVDSAGHATFASALPDKIGVGDVIIYDGNGDHLLNSSDVILFISGRNSATSYQVELENGTTSTATFSDNNTWSIYRAYTSLYNAVNASANVVNPSIPVTFDSFGGAKDLTAANQVWNIACYGDATDTARVYVYGWTTSPADYLRIYAPFLSSEVGASQRHSGTWDDTKYRLAVTAALDYVNAIGIYDKYVRVDGLQVSIANADYETTGAITLDSTAADGVIYISNNIIRGVYTTSGIDSMMGIFVYNPGTHYIFNNIVYGIKQGEYAGGAFVLDGGASYVYNNTIAGSELGILVDTGVVVAKNNIVQGADDGYIYEFDPTSDYNISNAADTTGGAHDQLSTSVAFANSVHDDYHLATNDTAAIGHGANLSADSDLSFSTDIDGQSRGAIWDIGADEYATTTPTQIYRSVGPGNTAVLADMDTTDSVLAINYYENSVATFSGGLPDNIGVGDAIVFDSDDNGSYDSLVFIYERLDATRFLVKTADGQTPSMTFSGAGLWKIYRAYTSLRDAANAASLVQNPSITIPFDNQPGIGNISNNATGTNEVWNIACYGDAVDTVGASVSGWTTGPDNYLRIYTPYLSSEVGISQRHSGKWDDAKYSLQPTAEGDGIYVTDGNDYTRIEGLQIQATTWAPTGDNAWEGSWRYGIEAGWSKGLIISHNIIRNGNQRSTGRIGIFVWPSPEEPTYIFDNLVYGFKSVNVIPGADVAGPNEGIFIESDGSLAYVFDNTVVDNSNGIGESYERAVLKNNLVFGSLHLDYEGTINSDSDYNAYASGTPYFESEGVNNEHGLNLSGYASTSIFVDPANQDYRLAENSPAINQGENLSADPNLSFADDIASVSRPQGEAWDIGANEYSGESFDITPPVITSFVLPATSSGLTVSGISVSATDNIGVTAYKFTESSTTPSFGSPDWQSASGTLSYSFATAGEKKLYAWAKDAAGNVSASASGTVDIVAAQIYYSVGQNTNDHKTGSPTITISGGVATFSQAQTATNLGVGDKISYGSADATTTIYISAKQSTTVWNVITAKGAQPAATTTAAVLKISHAFNSLANAMTGASGANYLNTSDLVAGDYILNIPCYYDSGPDTTSAVVNGYTTGVSNYIKIYTPNNTATEVNRSQRHSGKWDNSRYRLEYTGSNHAVIDDSVLYLKVEGLQIKTVTTGGGDWIAGIGSGQSLAQQLEDGILWTSNNIIQGIMNDDYWSGGISRWGDTDVSAFQLYAWNNIIYGYNSGADNSFKACIKFYGGSAYLYNNTVYGCNTGIAKYGGNYSIKNNISYDNNENYVVGGAGVDYGSLNNLSGSTQSDAPGSSPQNAKIVSFFATSTTNFHLLDSATNAIDHGANLSADPYLSFSTDIDGQTRSGTWDIGADEYVPPTANVYYSVGQNTDDHKTGAPTITIADGVAIFSEAQTALNMGVGDKISFGDSSATTTVYISAKQSTTVWNVVTATGGEPKATTTAEVLKISHAFSSLANAVTGVSGMGYLDTSDLVAGNYILNIPCYYDSGPDTTAVTVTGWTTGTNNYIKIYTPSDTATEVNLSQRQAGIWDDSKYSLAPSSAVSLNNSVGNLRIIGLQISNFGTDEYVSYAINLGGSVGGDVEISNSILRGTTSASAVWFEGIEVDGEYATVKIWNNIIYDFQIGIDEDAYTTAYYYNNTFYDCWMTGIWAENATIIAKNNLSYNIGASDGDYLDPENFSVAENNLSHDGSSPNSSLRNKTISFANAAGADFHLSADDTDAIGAGENLSADLSLAFPGDIDGQPRGSVWDIGADQFVAPIISAIGTSTAGMTATITWTTGKAATSTVEYGLTDAYGNSSSSNVFVTAHSITLRGLDVPATYHYRIKTTDADGSETVSADHTFTTFASGIHLLASTGVIDSGDEAEGVTTPAINTTGASLIVVGLHVYNSTSTISITDSMNNTWYHLRAYGVSGEAGYAQIWYAYHPTTSPTQTFSVNGAPANFPALTVTAWSGISTTSDPYDTGNGNTANDGNTISTGSVTPASAGELLLSVFSGGDSNATDFRINSGFNVSDSEHNWSDMDGAMAYYIAPDTNSYDPTWTVTGDVNNSAAIAAFRPANTEGSLVTSTPAQIYRSVGPGNTVALATGSGSFTLTIDNGAATFSGGTLPDNAGVGDAIVYDSNDNGNLDSGDSIVFIMRRYSDSSYEVQTEAGATSTTVDISATAHWAVYRAYTSLHNATNFYNTPNSSIPVSFDQFDGSPNLVANNKVWNIACYGDAVDTDWVSVVGWNTSEENYIRIYTPTSTSEVGVTQRHNGAWDDTKYRLEYNVDQSITVLHTEDQYLKIDGLQIKVTSDHYDSAAIGGWSTNTPNGGIWASNNIIWGELSYNTDFYGIYRLDWTGTEAYNYKMYVWNNIIYGFKYGSSTNSRIVGVYTSAGDAYIYNNTIIDCNKGIAQTHEDYSVAYDYEVVAKNNLVFDNKDDYYGTFTASSNHNAYYEGAPSGASDSLDLSSYSSSTLFINPVNNDFRLKAGSPIIDHGTNLSADPALALNHDIANIVRPQGAAWDIGADEYVSSTPSDNIPPVITLTGTSTTATSATITWTTDEPATSSIRYGLDSGYGFASSSNSLDTEHSITLRDLDSSTIYHFQISSTDAAGNRATSSDHAFTTAESGGGTPSDNTPPTIDSFEVSSTSASLSVPIILTASDDTGVTGYLVNEFSAIPSPSDPEWRSSATTTYIFVDAGSKTLYAWARDAAGNISSSASASVIITMPTYTIGGTVSGLSGTLTLQNNGDDDLVLTDNGPYVFPTALQNGAGYVVSVFNQPEGQLCSVQHDSGTIAGENISNINVSCEDISALLVIYQISSSTTADSATISWMTNSPADSSVDYGLDEGYGISSSSPSSDTVHSVVLRGLINDTVYHFRINAVDTSDNLASTSDLTFQTTLPPFILAYSAGANGHISGVSPQTVIPWSNGSPVSATPDSGYHFVNWSDTSTANPRTDTDVAGDISVTANFAINTYSLTASSSSYGTILPAGVTTKDFGASQTYTITPTAGYHITGLLIDSVLIGATSTYMFTGISANHAIGVVYAADENPDTYSIGGSVSGLSGTVILKNNGGDALSILANGSFAFATEMADGAAYAVTVSSNPSGQTCTISAGSGTVDEADVSSVRISCSNNTVVINNGGGGGGGGLTVVDTIPPGVPNNFFASSTGIQIYLFWKNPTDNDFAGVKLYRKAGSAPTGQNDSAAKLVYQGKDQKFVDAYPVSDQPCFYSIYAYDARPNYSAAKIIAVQIASVVNNLTPTPIISLPAANPGSSSNGSPVSAGNNSSLIGASSAVANQITADEAANLLAQVQPVELNVVEKNVYDRVIALADQPLPETEKNIIAYFIHIGTPTTKPLGAGERGGTISSFQAAFGHLPVSLADWQDAIKIGNGRWPNAESREALRLAKVSFQTIYQRPANMNNAKDNAAVTVMAYGLRPAARNFTSEKNAIISYRWIFKRDPVTARAWDAVRAIAYSGAKR